MFLTSFNVAKISVTTYCLFDITTQYLGIKCLVNRLTCFDLKPWDGISSSCGWDKQVMWVE